MKTEEQKIFSSEHNCYFSILFVKKAYNLYINYCKKHSLIPDYTKSEFEDLLLEDNFPEEFMVKLLYQSEFEGINIEEFKLD